MAAHNATFCEGGSMTTEKQAFDAIIHIGAGRGGALQSYLAAGARRIVLVDADSAAVVRLRRLAAGASNADTAVEVVQAAVAGNEKDAELRIYNLERVSGIREPEALIELYRNLRLVRSSIHRTREAAHLIEDLGIDPARANKLIIDTPGEEHAILQNLERKNLLPAFSEIVAYASRRALYKGAAGVTDVAAALNNAGYIVQSEDGGDWITLRAFRARTQDDVFEIERLGKELARAEAARAAQEKKVIELSKKVAELEANPVDAADRKAIFDIELDRCEMQIDHLKELLVNRREG